MVNLLYLAQGFREALASCLDGSTQGTCQIASEAFGRYLDEEHDIKAQGINGWSDAHERRHDWLEIEGDLVDLTSEQFASYPEFLPLPSSIVLPTASAWHRRHFPDRKPFDAVDYPRTPGAPQVESYPDLLRWMRDFLSEGVR